MYRLGVLSFAFLCFTQGCGGGGGDSGDDAGDGDSGTPVCAHAALEITHTAGTPAQPIVHVLDLAEHPTARCNDGTPGTYTFRPGFGAGTKRWVIYLEGGGECADAEKCAARYATTPAYMTSTGATDGAVFTGDLEGLKSTNASINPDFYDANFVQMDYCSSDVWTGDKEGNGSLPTTDIGRWHFRGRAIFEAVIADLMAQGLGDAEDVLLSGSSAGGIGVVHRADDLAASVPAARVVALVDAGFFIDYPSFDPVTDMESTAFPTERATELMEGVTHWGGGGDADCEALAVDIVSQTYCRSVFDAMHNGHVRTRLFLRQSELDGVQLKLLGLARTNMTTAANAYRMRFVTRMLEKLDMLPDVAAFVSRDAQHGIINDDAAWQAGNVGTAMLPATFGAWYRDPCTASVHIER